MSNEGKISMLIDCPDGHALKGEPCEIVHDMPTICLPRMRAAMLARLRKYEADAVTKKGAPSGEFST